MTVSLFAGFGWTTWTTPSQKTTNGVNATAKKDVDLLGIDEKMKYYSDKLFNSKDLDERIKAIKILGTNNKHKISEHALLHHAQNIKESDKYDARVLMGVILHALQGRYHPSYAKPNNIPYVDNRTALVSARIQANTSHSAMDIYARIVLNWKDDEIRKEAMTLLMRNPRHPVTIHTVEHLLKYPQK